MQLGLVMTALGIIAAGTGLVPTMADEDRYLAYLDEHGYTAHYASGKPVPRSSTIMYGHYVCKNLQVSGDPGSSSTLPQFSLIVDAARHALCPDTPAAS